MDIEETPVPLPSAPVVQLAPHLILQPPLTRRGHGPGLILLVPNSITALESDSLDPKPLQKWAEEGYAVVQVEAQDSGFDITRDLKTAIEALVALPACDETEKIGLIS
jgi:carboxymethylenebutenolidase